MMEFMNGFFYWSGAALWLFIALVALAILARVAWDGFRALTITVWSSMICKKKTGSYFFKGMLLDFLRNWGNLIGRSPGAITLSGPSGYWNDWNDWKVYGGGK